MDLSDRPSSSAPGVGPAWRRGSRTAGAAASFALAAGSAALARRVCGPGQIPPTPEPVAPGDYFSPAEIRAGRRFAGPQRALGTAGSVLELSALAALARRRYRLLGDPAAPVTARSARRAALAAGARGSALVAATTVLKLPTDAVAHRRAVAIGLSTQDWNDWATDRLKATALEAALTGALHVGSSALASRWGRRWWLPASAGAVALAVLSGLLAPVITDPIFNDFTPLPEGETRADVLDLAAGAGVSVGEVYSIDASRRTTAVNAYVNGLGPTKRVVLFDTLLSDYSRDEVRFVVAHELGHVRHRDVWRLIGFLALSAPAATLAVQELTGLWAGGLSGPEAVPALYVSASLVLTPLVLAGAALSRAVERRTDDYGLGLSGSPDALISFFRRIAVQNHADVTDGGVLARILATHPPITERIGAAVAFAD